MKAVITLSIEHYEFLLKRTTEDSVLYSRLKNAVMISGDTAVVLCGRDEATMLLDLAGDFCPEAIREIDQAMRVFNFLDR